MPIILPQYTREYLPMFFRFYYHHDIGFLSWLPKKYERRDPNSRWIYNNGTILVSIKHIRRITFCFISETNLSFIDALFESISGLTTTGATVSTNLEDLPKSILYYRQQLQWLGGIGIRHSSFHSSNDWRRWNANL